MSCEKKNHRCVPFFLSLLSLCCVWFIIRKKKSKHLIWISYHNKRRSDHKSRRTETCLWFPWHLLQISLKLNRFCGGTDKKSWKFEKMTTRKKNKNQQKESGGFIKKVSSLFNLDTVMLWVFFIFFWFDLSCFTWFVDFSCFEFHPLTINCN